MTEPRTYWPMFEIVALFLIIGAVVVFALAVIGMIFAIAAKMGLAPWPM